MKITSKHKGNPQLEGSSQEVGDGINHFSGSMQKHFSEEEEIVFPLALKVDSR